MLHSFVRDLQYIVPPDIKSSPEDIYFYLFSGVRMFRFPCQRLLFSFLIVLIFGISWRYANALGQTRYVSSSAGKGSFALAANGRTAMLYVDSADYPGVVRAAHDLQADIERVTGLSPELR